MKGSVSPLKEAFILPLLPCLPRFAERGLGQERQGRVNFNLSVLIKYNPKPSKFKIVFYNYVVLKSEKY
jgi:hypothetical protein